MSIGVAIVICVYFVAMTIASGVHERRSRWLISEAHRLTVDVHRRFGEVERRMAELNDRLSRHEDPYR